jgi:2OG-Fe(II) oxygenase superfamily
MFLSASSPAFNAATSSSPEVVSNDCSVSGGLYIQARTGECVRVAIPSDHCAFQIGETSQIMSGGLLQATPHAVLPPASNVSRESFALFLEPEFDDPLMIPPGFTVEDCQGGFAEDCGTRSLGLRPLKDRWKVGQTFGDFHLATVTAFTAS